VETAAPPKRRPTPWVFLLLLCVLLAGAGGFVWYIWSQVGTRPDGTRVVFEFPGVGGAVASPSVGGAVASPSVNSTLSADLKAEGAEILGAGTRHQIEQQVFLRREKITLAIRLHAGKHPIDTTRLTYVLFAKDGAELSRGALGPETLIAVGGSEIVEVADPHVLDAVRVEIRKLP
jgi:hypothetical protein